MRWVVGDDRFRPELAVWTQGWMNGSGRQRYRGVCEGMDLCGGALRDLAVGLFGEPSLHLGCLGVQGLGSDSKRRMGSGGLRLRRGGGGL